jgi:hypothetical protein
VLLIPDLTSKRRGWQWAGEDENPEKVEKQAWLGMQWAAEPESRRPSRRGYKRAAESGQPAREAGQRAGDTGKRIGEDDKAQLSQDSELQRHDIQKGGKTESYWVLRENRLSWTESSAGWKQWAGLGGQRAGEEARQRAG